MRGSKSVWYNAKIVSSAYFILPRVILYIHVYITHRSRIRDFQREREMYKDEDIYLHTSLHAPLVNRDKMFFPCVFPFFFNE